MLKAFTLSLNQMGDKAIIRVLIKSLLVTLVLCVLLGLGAASLAQLYFDHQVDANPYASTYSAVSGVLGAIVWLLVVVFGFRLIAIPVIGFFADEIVAAVEAKHYPARALAARKVGIGLSLRLGLMSALRALLFNLLALPLYIVLLVTAIGPLALFLFINAILLGRDLGEMVAVRHLDQPSVRRWLDETRGARLLVGLGATALFMVPVANILAPIVGAAMATHIFHNPRLRGLIGGE